MTARWLAVLALLGACKSGAKQEERKPPPPGDEQPDEPKTPRPFVIEPGSAPIARDDRFLYWLGGDGVFRRALGGPSTAAATKISAVPPGLADVWVRHIAIHAGVLHAQTEDALFVSSLDDTAPKKLLELLLQDVAVDDSGIYVASEALVLRIPLAGGDPETVVTAPAPIVAIALFDGSVYWAEEHAIRKRALTGGDTAVVLETTDELDSFAVDGRGLVHAGSQAMIERTRMGPVYVRRGFWIYDDEPEEIVLDDAWIYLVDSSVDSEFVATPRDDGDPVLVAGDPRIGEETQFAAGKLFSLLLSDEEVPEDEDAPARVIAADLATGAITELAPFADRPWELEIGDGFVYWGGVAGEGLWRAPVTGGPPELYSKTDWLDGGYLGIGPGVVYFAEGQLVRGRRAGSAEAFDVGTAVETEPVGRFAVIGDALALADDVELVVFEPSKARRVLWRSTVSFWMGLELMAYGDELLVEDDHEGLVAVKLDGTLRQLIPGHATAGISAIVAGAGLAYANRTDALFRVDLATGTAVPIRGDVLDLIASTDDGLLLRFGEHAALLPHDAPPRVEPVVSQTP